MRSCLADIGVLCGTAGRRGTRAASLKGGRHRYRRLQAGTADNRSVQAFGSLLCTGLRVSNSSLSRSFSCPTTVSHLRVALERPWTQQTGPTLSINTDHFCTSRRPARRRRCGCLGLADQRPLFLVGSEASDIGPADARRVTWRPWDRYAGSASSFSPRATMRRAPFGKGRCSAFALGHGAVSQVSHSLGLGQDRRHRLRMDRTISAFGSVVSSRQR